MSNLDCSIYCPYCNRHTSLQIAPAEYNGQYGSREPTGAVWRKSDFEKWWIGVCNSCHQPVLVLNAGERVFPYPNPSPTDNRIPENIRKDLLEAKQCFGVNAFRGCAVMARRAMQSTCIDKGATKHDLVEQLKELQESGVITKDLKEWAKELWEGYPSLCPIINQ